MARPKKEVVPAVPAPTWEEMEEKRKEMIATLSELGEVLKRASDVMTTYVSLSPLHMASPADLKRTAEEAELGPDGKKKKKKQEKKEKDPNAPKRPSTAYFLYQNETRESLKNENPGISNNALMGLVAEKWGAMPDEEKKKYLDKAHIDMAAWKVVNEEYKAGQVNGGAPTSSAPEPKVASVAVPDVAVTAAAESSDSSSSGSDSDSSSEDSESEGEAVAPVVSTPAKGGKKGKTVATKTKTTPKSKAKESPVKATPVPAEKKTRKGKK